MKKVLTLILLIGALPLFGQEWPTNFILSKLKWGMSLEEVMAAYPGLAKHDNFFYLNGVDKQAGYYKVFFSFYPCKKPGDLTAYRPGVLEGVGFNYTRAYPPGLPEFAGASVIDKAYELGPYLPVMERLYGTLVQSFTRNYGHPDSQYFNSNTGLSLSIWNKPHVTVNLGLQRGSNGEGSLKKGASPLLAVQFSNPHIRDDVQDLARAREYWSFTLMHDPEP